MTMRLNETKPAHGARKTRLRVGRGASAGQGKTCGRGVKGQRARKGGYHKVGFEGGQMPIQRRMPKVGFRSMMEMAEVRLDELAKVEGTEITLDTLKKANVIPSFADRAKVEATVDAQRRLYRLTPAPLQELDAWLAPFRQLWSRHVDALERHLDRAADTTSTASAKTKPRRQAKPRTSGTKARTTARTTTTKKTRRRP